MLMCLLTTHAVPKKQSKAAHRFPRVKMEFKLSETKTEERKRKTVRNKDKYEVDIKVL